MQGRIGRWVTFAVAALALAGCSHEPSDGTLAVAASPELHKGGGDSAAGVLRRADELRGKGESIAALSLLTEAHRRDPADPAIASSYGRLALQLGHDEMAAPALDRAISANPEDWRALSAKGVLESRRGHFPDGRRALTQANKLSASEAVILNNLAVSHLLDGKPGAAISLLRQGLAAPGLRSPHERRLTRNLALAMAMEGRFEEAQRLAGEKLPRELASGDTALLRRLVGVSPTERHAGAGWQAQIADASRPPRPAVQ
jgi:Flp pilus assembly protein TadD